MVVFWVMSAFLIVLYYASYEVLTKKDFKDKKEKEKIETCFKILWTMLLVIFLIITFVTFEIV